METSVFVVPFISNFENSKGCVTAAISTSTETNKLTYVHRELYID